MLNPDPATADPAPPPPPGNTGFTRVLAGCAWAYLIGILVVWAVLRFVGEAWWPGTLLLLGPRWVLAIPALLLAVPAVLSRGPLRWQIRLVVLLAGLIVLGPVMDLCLPWRRLVPANGVGPAPVGMLTCNVHGHSADADALASTLQSTRADIAVFEEWCGWTTKPPGQPLIPGWNCATSFEARVESRYPVRYVKDVISAHGWAEGSAALFEVSTPQGPVPVIAVHLASPHGVISAAIRRQNRETGAAVKDNANAREDQASDVADAARAAGSMVICAGDFNLPCDSQAFRQDLTQLNDAFSLAGCGFGWTYRVRGTVTRIDHILTGPAWRCRRSWVGPNVGSPHRPLLAELDRLAPTT